MASTQRTRTAWFLAALLPLTMAGGVFGGVAQTRSLQTMQSNYGTAGTVNTNGNLAYVNPSYSNQRTVYQGENGAVAVGPYGAAAVGPNGSVAVRTNANVAYGGYNAVAVSGYYTDYNSYAATAPPGGGQGIPIGAIVQNVPSTAAPVQGADGTTYYYDNNAFFVQVYDGGDVVYQVVMAPLGAVVTQLPAGCAVQYYNGTAYQQCGSTYFQQVAGGYQVVGLN